MTPVTEADRQSGKIIKQLIARNYPDDAINEEETGEKQGDNRIWYVDPLDGTSSFTREQKYSSVGIVVYENSKPYSGAICQPFERELIVAEAGKGAYLFELDEKLTIIGEPKKIEVSSAKELEGSIVYVDALFNNKTTPNKLELIRQLVELSNGRLGIRMTGSNIDQQRQVANGRAEASITDAVGGFYDLAAGSLIIQEAGGKFVDLDGNDINENTQVALGGAGEIIDKILPIIRKIYSGYKGFK
jgi:fructose-1,6-bisphosphatase/inositol monophosphatase family enzyme